MTMPGRNGSATDQYRYGYQGSEKDDEVKGNGNSYTTHFRQHDPRVGRWLSIDPKSRKFPWSSPYVSMSNNPIYYNDPLGDEFIGTDKKSARRVKRNMKNETFSREQFKDFRKLIKVKGDRFKKIAQNDFDDATRNLSTDEKALALGYFKMINAPEKHFINAVKRRESVDLDHSELTVTNLKQAFVNAGISSGQDADDKLGGGGNIASSGQSLTVVVVDSKALVNDFEHPNIIDPSTGDVKKISRSSSFGELIAHEAIGHGLGALSGSSTSGHEDAIQMTNLFLRTTSSPNGAFRTGESHGTGVRLNESQRSSIPAHVTP